jgi:hypothetical protein
MAQRLEQWSASPRHDDARATIRAVPRPRFAARSFLLVACLGAAPASAQVKGPAAPAITSEQTVQSEALAAKYDESATKEKRRLELFADRPLGAVIQRSFNIFTNYLAMSAAMMPESGYGFRPTPDVRTFGEQINHATTTQYSFCNQTGLPPGVQKKMAPAAVPSTKAAIIAAFKESTAYCDSILAAATESWLMEVVPAVGGASSGQIRGIRAHIFIYNIVHSAEDYGTITTYLRMQGVVPPSTALHPAAPARGRGAK